MSSATPFDGFEVGLVAEYPNPGRWADEGTFCERVDDFTEIDPDEVLRTFYTVYGHRSPPDWNSPEYNPNEEYGATAIADFESRDEAFALAMALADGKPVYDFTPKETR